MSDKAQATERTSSEKANEFLESVDDAPDELSLDNLANIEESLFGPPPEEPVPNEVIDFEKSHNVPKEDSEPEQAEQDEVDEIDYQAEYKKLKTKIGKQASVQGDLRERAEKAEAELARLQSQGEQSLPPISFNGKSFSQELAKQRGVEIPEDLQDIYSVVGEMLLAYTQNLGQHLKPLGDQLGAMKESLAETAAEASLGGGLSPEVKSQVLEENPGLREIKNPNQRVAMMKKLALAEGLIRDEGGAKRAAAASRRSPSRHVSSSGSSGPTKSRTETLNEALGKAIESAQSQDDLDKMAPVMSHYFKSMW